MNADRRFEKKAIHGKRQSKVKEYRSPWLYATNERTTE